MSPASTCSMTREGASSMSGKAKSIRKRVASHFSNPSTRAGRDLLRMIDRIEALVVQTRGGGAAGRAELHPPVPTALQHQAARRQVLPVHSGQPRRGFPRVYFTPETPSQDRAYFGPFSGAKRTRATLEVLGKVFMFRSLRGARPGRRSGLAVPGLLHQALPGTVRRLHLQGGLQEQHRRRDRVPVGRYREIERRWSMR